MNYLCATILVLFALLNACECDNRRPFYNIAHMVNSIGQIKKYLNRGANAIELDVQFNTSGWVKVVYHGVPCDCFRTCTRGSVLQEYLEYVRYITDPSIPGSYSDKLTMLFFDLKLSGSEDQRIVGRDLARHVFDFLWSKEGERKQEIRVIVSSDKMSVFRGFLQEFEYRGQKSRLKDVGFDFGLGKINEGNFFKFAFFGYSENIWIGDGVTNCLSAFYPDEDLKKLILRRDSNWTFAIMKKVFHWTIDYKFQMRRSLDMGVDAMITNDPDDLVEVLQESPYRHNYRLATPDDNPFEKFRANAIRS